MKIFCLIPAIIFALCISKANGQMERTMYQVFEVDSVKTVTFDLVGNYEVYAWAGSNILVETNIQIWEASREILNFLIKDGRYDITQDTAAAIDKGVMTIQTKNKERKPIKRREGRECPEQATIKIFFPDTFILSEDKKVLTRIDPNTKG
jgi:hypothetical protein